MFEKIPDQCFEEQVERAQTHRDEHVLGFFVEGIRDALLGRQGGEEHADIPG